MARLDYLSNFRELPFFGASDFDVNSEYISVRHRLNSLLRDNGIVASMLDDHFDISNNNNNICACKYYDEDEYSEIAGDSSRVLNVMSMNIRSLPKHKGELLAYLSNLPDYHILVLSEIGAKNMDLVVNALPNHNFYYIIPDKNPRGGIGIYISKYIEKCSTIDNIYIRKTCQCIRCEFESLVVNFTYNDLNYTLLGAYRHPNGNREHFTYDLDNTLKLLDVNRSWILAGDINIDLIKYHIETPVLNYVTMLMSYKLLPLITYPTRITSYTATCIDHICVRFNNLDKYSCLTPGVLYCDISDHLPTTLCISYISRIRPKARPFVRIFGEKNCDKFINELQSLQWDQILNHDCYDDWYSIFISRIKSLYSRCFPLKRQSRARQKDKPWITKGLKISIKYKNRLYKKSIVKPTDHIRARYSQYNLTLKKCIKQAETNHYRRLFDECGNNARQTWKLLSTILNRKARKSTSITELLYNDTHITEHKAIADAFNDHFCSIGGKLASKLPNYGTQYKNFLKDRLLDSFFLPPISVQEIVSEIKRLNPKKSPGPDGIGAKLLRLSPNTFAFPLEKIFNHYIRRGEYPDLMKIAKVIAIYKKGNKNIPDNYRPISLLSCFNKIFEKILHRNLMLFFERQKILFIYQFGFRVLHSTTFALIETVDTIKQKLDEGNYVLGIYLDLTKAFDTVDHEILLYKLAHYGIRGHANDFFRSYLTNRKQFTYINGKESSTKEMKYGVPQGSVLGPLFFLIYINDIQCVDDPNSVRLFADDTFIFRYNKNLNLLINTTRTYFKKLQKWFVCNKLTLNHSKSCFSIFHTKNKPIPENLNEIVIEDVVIKRERCVKYIGLMIDEDLRWKDHVTELLKNLVKYFGIFNQIKDYISVRLARQLYFAFVHSRIKYGIEVYGSCSGTLLQKIQITQNKLLKLLLRKHPRTSTNELHNDLKLLKIGDIHKNSLSLFTHDCLSNRVPVPLQNYFRRRWSQHNTRQSDQLVIDRTRTTLGSSRVQYQAAKIWNDLNPDLKLIPDRHHFKSVLKHNTISAYARN